MSTKVEVEPIKWKLSIGKEKIFVYNNNGYVGISGTNNNDQFIFKGYKTIDDINRARNVTKLLHTAIEFMENALLDEAVKKKK